MEFKSQICTTREQSQRLLALGVKPETADMVYHCTGSRVESLQWELQTKPPTLRGEFWTAERIAKLARGGESGEEVFDKLWGKDVPAWSLMRLLELVSCKFAVTINGRCAVLFKDYESIEPKVGLLPGIFDFLINVIEETISDKTFNEEYYNGE